MKSTCEYFFYLPFSAQQGKGVMGRHRYPCQSNTQVSYMTSEVVTPSTHPTGVLPAS